jgi:hypothetical protein
MSKNQKNKDYQTDWEKYVKANRDAAYMLLPLEIGMTESGEFYRKRMAAAEVAKIRDGIIGDFPDYMDSNPLEFGEPKDIFGRYIEYFKKHDGADMAMPKTPFDLRITHPTWVLFSLGNLNWKFTKKGPQFSTECDHDGFERNFVKVGLFDDPRLPKKRLHGQPLNERKLFILANRNRCAPKGLKYNLHVDVLQTINRKNNSTMIVIDPSGSNSPRPPWGEDP